MEAFVAPSRHSGPKSPLQVQEKMNELGSEGWELVTATESYSPETFLYFKRPKP